MYTRTSSKTCSVAVLIAGFSLVGCNGRNEPTTATVTTRDVIGYQQLEGELVTPPSARADVHPQFRAPVDQVMTSVGQSVRKGDVLVQLSFPDADAAYQQGRMTVQAAEQALEAARSRLGTEVRLAEEQLTQARQAERTARQMAEEGAASDLERLRNERVAAEQNVQALKRELEISLLPYKQQLEDAREYMRQAQQGAKQASVRAPIGGTVLVLNAQPGREVGTDPDAPIAVIVDLASLQVHAPFDSSRGVEVEENSEVLLTFSEVEGEQFEGRVSRITTQQREGKELVRVAIIQLQNKQGLVKPDMSPSLIAVKTGEVKDVLAVPNGAVRRDSSGRPTVEVLRGEKWEAVVVEIGLVGLDHTEIKSGLQQGDTVRVR